MKSWIFSPWITLLLGLGLLGMGILKPVQEFQQLRPGAELTYALDDPYIHLAIAKNLVQHGVWGVTPQGFTSSSSSLLWTLLLAAVVWVFGPQSLIPLWMGLVFSLLAVWMAWKMIRELLGPNPGPAQTVLSWLALLMFVLGAPLAPLVLSGMETSLQIFLTLAFTWAAVNVLQYPQEKASRRAQVVLGFLFVATRYEHLALVALVTLAFLWQRRWRLAAALAVAALLPVVVFGLVSLANGWFFLPASVMVKIFASGPTWWSDPAGWLRMRAGQNLGNTYRLLLALGLGVLALLLVDWKTHFAGARACWLGLLFLPALFAQVLAGQIGWFFRYEAYVVALGWLALVGLAAAWLKQVKPSTSTGRLQALAALAILLLAAVPLYIRGSGAAHGASGGMTNIYDQQVQMARFLKTYYAGQNIIINDIGAISLWSEVGVVDLAGLATKETALARSEGRPLRPVVDALIREKQVKVAIVYYDWWPPELLAGWQVVGAWTLEMPVTVGGSTVVFYAIDPNEAAPLRQHLNEFAPNLHPSVEVEVW